MALIDLKSDLSWYGKTPPGFAPNADKTQTDFQYNADLTVTAFPKGYSPLGDAVSFTPRTSLDGLPLDNGSATRKAQLGQGTRFPIGPEGQVHEFDIKRTGWYIGRPYSAVYSNKVPFGLAASYTNNSPIDDMYNKFKVREEAYDPFGYAKPPFILRGIQQDGESDPQRWGLAGTALANASMEVPRGGIAASVERAALDAVRLGKFLIRPQGILFLAKQQLLHLMQPNTEDILGAANIKSRQKLFNPVNMLASAVGGIAGLRFKRYGVPFEGDGSTYGEIHKLRIAGELGIVGNRLVTLNDQRIGKPGIQDVSPSWLTISNILGPDSVGGIGGTFFTRYSDYNTNRKISGNWTVTDVGAPAIDALYTRDQPYAGAPGPIGLGNRPLVDGGIATLDQNDRDISPRVTAYTKYPYILDAVRSQKKTLWQRNNEKSGFDDENTFILTGIKTQIAFHGGAIIGLPGGDGTYDGYSNVRKLYNEPYIGEQNDTKITGDTISGNETRENDLVSFTSPKTYATNLKNTVNVTDHSKDKFWGGVVKTTDDLIKENLATKTPSLEQYRALTYGTIQGITRERPNMSGKLIDFRTGTEWSQTDDATRKNTLESYYGYKAYNEADLAKKSNPDPIQNLDYGQEYSGDTKDLIKFRFESVGYSGTNGKPIIFRAYLNNLTDQFSPSWNGTQDQGRADQKVLYASFARSIDLSFKVVVHSAAEQHNVWQKLSALARNTYPVYAGSGFHGQFIRVTIGDLYVKQYMYITGLTYDWDNETPWEITDGMQVPLYTNVDMNLSWVGTSKPKAQQYPYSYGGTGDNNPTPAPGDGKLDAPKTKKKKDSKSKQTPPPQNDEASERDIQQAQQRAKQESDIKYVDPDEWKTQSDATRVDLPAPLRKPLKL